MVPAVKVNLLTPALKGKLLQTTGWVVVGVGIYLIIVGDGYGDKISVYSKSRPRDDNIIDAEWVEVK